MWSYVDRDNNPISKERWWELFRAPEGSRPLCRIKGHGWELEASWVGCSCTAEPFPRNFLVRTLAEQVKNGERLPIEGHPDAWFATPEEARNEVAARRLRLCRKTMFPGETHVAES